MDEIDEEEIDEEELASAGQRGAVVDGMAGGRKRTVQAALLRKCCHELKGRIDPRGLRLSNIVVAGLADLPGGHRRGSAEALAAGAGTPG
jgi:hypothetical protein